MYTLARWLLYSWPGGLLFGTGTVLAYFGLTALILPGVSPHTGWLAGIIIAGALSFAAVATVVAGLYWLARREER